MKHQTRWSISVGVGLLLGCTALLSCTVPEPSVTERLEMDVQLPARVHSDAPLRTAVVWVQGSPVMESERELLVSWDQRYPGRSNFTALFTFPRGVDWSRLRHSTQLYVPQNLSWDHEVVPNWQTFVGYRPRVVVYEDVNENGRLDLVTTLSSGPSLDNDVDAGVNLGSPPLDETESQDRIVALDSNFQGVLALQAPEQLVSELSLGSASYYYRFSNGLNRFVSVASEGGSLFLSDQQSIPTSVGHPVMNRIDLLCGRQANIRISYATPHVTVDSRIDLHSICGLDSVKCESADFQATQKPTWSLEQPEVLEPDPSSTRMQTQCKRRETLDTLLIRRSTQRCSYCECTIEFNTDIYVVNRKTRPDWWPCGTDVGYCDAGNLRELNVECSLVFGPGDTDAGSLPRDAGPNADADTSPNADAGR